MTTGLLSEFSLVLHSGLMAAKAGYFSRDLYDKVGQAINCVRMALEIKPPKEKSVIIVIDGAVRSMNEAGARGDKTGEWTLRAAEQASILAGIQKIEESLERLDVVTLYEAMQKIKLLDTGCKRA